MLLLSRPHLHPHEIPQGLAALESELPEAYDYAAPCFPPGWNAFDALFQLYHVQVGQDGWIWNRACPLAPAPKGDILVDDHPPRHPTLAPCRPADCHRGGRAGAAFRVVCH